MHKKLILPIVLVVCLLFTACSKEQLKLSTEIGDFAIDSCTFYDTYNDLRPADGEVLLAVNIDAAGTNNLDGIQPYFLPINGSVTQVSDGVTPKPCIMVAYEYSGDEVVRYVLLFSVPEEYKDSKIDILVPNGQPQTVKEKGGFLS